MDYDVKELINNLTSAIIKEYEIKLPIDDMRDVVRKIGGIIEVDYFISEYADAILEKYKDGFKITIPNITSEKRKKYVIARELGHLFLHMQYQIDSSFWNSQPKRCYYSTNQGIQANAFGMALLMPKFEFKNVIDDNSDGDKVNMAPVAKHFGVLQNIAIERGYFLSYIER